MKRATTRATPSTPTSTRHGTFYILSFLAHSVDMRSAAAQHPPSSTSVAPTSSTTPSVSTGSTASLCASPPPPSDMFSRQAAASPRENSRAHLPGHGAAGAPLLEEDAAEYADILADEIALTVEYHYFACDRHSASPSIMLQAWKLATFRRT